MTKHGLCILFSTDRVYLSGVLVTYHGTHTLGYCSIQHLTQLIHVHTQLVHILVLGLDLEYYRNVDL